MYKERRQSISKEGGPGAPICALRGENTTAIIVRQDGHITLKALSEILKIWMGATHILITEKLNTRCVCVLWVSRLLIPEQDVRVQVCLQLKMMLQEDQEMPWKVMTAVISILRLNSRAICGNLRITNTKKAKVVASARKVMVISFFDIQGMVYHHVPPHTIVTRMYWQFWNPVSQAKDHISV